MRTTNHECSAHLPRLLQALAPAAALAFAMGALDFGAVEHAAVPAGQPTFSSPLVFTNTYFPFAPGAVKVYRGRSDGARTTDVDVFRRDTRDFDLDGTTVTCRILEEIAFEDGELVEISRNHFAQADDGTIYYFGEVVDIYENGVVVSHEGSFLVGGPVGNDPPETASISSPGVFMPANPEVGDEFRPEDVPGGPQEIDTIRRVGRKVKTSAGRFTGSIEVGEFNPVENESETKWYAPGVGVVGGKAQGERFSLDASIFRQN